MKQFHNPWYDARNELSPAVFDVDDEPVHSEDSIDFYTVRNDHQTPSVLAVFNRERHYRGVAWEKGDHNHRGGDAVVGQYVTVAGGIRALFGS